MKKPLAYFLACACLFWGSACSDLSEDEKPRITPLPREVEKPYDSRCIFKEDKNKRIDNTHPFDKATKIEAIAFDLGKVYKEYRDKRDKSVKADTYTKDMQKTEQDATEEPVKIENGELFVPYPTHRAFLTKEQTQKLFETIIFNDGDATESASCYEPYHVLVFYEGKKPFAFLELCFSCMKKRTFQCNFGTFCDQKWGMLRSLFPTPKKKD